MSDFEKKIQKLIDTPDTTYEYLPEDINKSKIFAVLAYISWFFFIPLLAAPKSGFGRYHANQGLLLTVLSVVLTATTRIVFGALRASSISIVAVIIIAVVSLVITVSILALRIVGIMNAVNGRARELPFIGSVKIIK